MFEPRVQQPVIESPRVEAEVPAAPVPGAIARIRGLIYRNVGRYIPETSMGVPNVAFNTVERAQRPPNAVPLRESARRHLARIVGGVQRAFRGPTTPPLPSAVSIPGVDDGRNDTRVLPMPSVLAPAANSPEDVHANPQPQAPVEVLPTIRQEIGFLGQKVRDAFLLTNGWINGSNRQLENLRGRDADDEIVRLRSQVAVSFVGRLFGNERVDPVRGYSFDVDTGLVMDRSGTVRCTIDELQERTARLRESPRVVDQRQANLNDNLLRHLEDESNVNFGNYRKREWDIENNRRITNGINTGYEEIHMLDISDRSQTREVPFTGELNNPNTYFQERRALELLGLQSPEEVEGLRDWRESYNDTIQRLYRERAPIIKADEYGLRLKGETDTQLQLRLIKETRNGRDIEDVVESMHDASLERAAMEKQRHLNNMPKAEVVRILRENLLQSSTRNVIGEIRDLPPVAMRNAARALLEQIESGDINSQKKDALQVDISRDQLASLVEMSNAPTTFTRPVEVPYVSSTFAGIFSAGDLQDAATGLDLTSVGDIYNFVSTNYESLTPDQKYQIAVWIPADMNIAMRMRLASEGKPLE